jgi:hypothetical protein
MATPLRISSRNLKGVNAGGRKKVPLRTRRCVRRRPAEGS